MLFANLAINASLPTIQAPVTTLNLISKVARRKKSNHLDHWNAVRYIEQTLKPKQNDSCKRLHKTEHNYHLHYQPDIVYSSPHYYSLPYLQAKKACHSIITYLQINTSIKPNTPR